MKNLWKKAVCMVLTVAMALTACMALDIRNAEAYEDGGPMYLSRTNIYLTDGTQPAESFGPYNLNSGRYQKINVVNANGVPSYRSTNKKVATVTQGGEITAKKPGSCKVVATVGSKKLTCNVRVFSGKNVTPKKVHKKVSVKVTENNHFVIFKIKNNNPFPVYFDECDMNFRDQNSEEHGCGPDRFMVDRNSTYTAYSYIDSKYYKRIGVSYEVYFGRDYGPDWNSFDDSQGLKWQIDDIHYHAHEPVYDEDGEDTNDKDDEGLVMSGKVMRQGDSYRYPISFYKNMYSDSFIIFYKGDKIVNIASLSNIRSTLEYMYYGTDEFYDGDWNNKAISELSETGEIDFSDLFIPDGANDTDSAYLLSWDGDYDFDRYEVVNNKGYWPDYEGEIDYVIN